MDHERYPHYFDDAPSGKRDYDPSLANAFLNAVEILRGLLSRDDQRLPVR